MRTTRLTARRETWTPDEARQLIEQWRGSGEPLAVFARRRGFHPARLYWWRKRFASPEPTSASLALVPATLLSTEAAITIRLPNGIAVDIAHPSPALVASLVAELTRSTL